MAMHMGIGRRWAALLVVAGLAGCGNGPADKAKPAKGTDGQPVGGTKPLKIGMMPKLIGISYFNACEKGAREAAKELGVDLVYDGPATDSAQQQVQMIDEWIGLGYDVIAVAPNDPEVIAPALRRAKEAGIVTLTWDADANPEASGRTTFVNQAPTDAIGNQLVDIMAQAIGGEGKTVIVTGSATSPNQNAWMKVMHARLAEKYPKIELLPLIVPNEDLNAARRMTADVLNAHPDLKGVWGITSVALPGAAEAVRQSGKGGTLFVTGLSLPSTTREYVLDGTVPRFVLWNPIDLGYLAVHVAKQIADGKYAVGTHDFGRLQGIEVREGEVILGPPFVFDKDNIAGAEF